MSTEINKIAIISDTHDNLATIDKFLAYIKINPVEAIIHCGDIAQGDTLGHIADNFNGKILAAFGNMDYRDSVKAIVKELPKKIILFDDFGQTEFCGLEIGFCHFKETGQAHLKKQRFDYIFYGHTHKPWMEKIDDCCFANPGTLAGMFYGATFAILDAKKNKLDLKIVNRLK